ncbi:transposase [uncultured Cycloclasticus sp.]|uniref:transposase n=1 Tax=uncultured Cycloclasticus sp. TaxID=172194 RepID=UPI00258B821B|nr:transposase [uncultured Cycloclasticus sp.]
MAQHFLLSAKSRTLSVRHVMEMSHQEAFEVFKALRWGSDENVACPCCGVISNHYFQRTRKTWRCKDCGHTFSVTSRKTGSGLAITHFCFFNCAANRWNKGDITFFCSDLLSKLNLNKSFFLTCVNIQNPR